MVAETHGNFAGKRLIVFGCGYIGGEIARQAVARGMRVTGLTRNPVKAEVWRKSGIEMIIADLAARGWHEDIAGGADFVLNCVSSGGGGIAGYRRSYVEGMDSVLTWARDRGAVGTMVYTSSTSVYPQDGGVTVDEHAPAGGDERADVLLAAETRLRQNGAACLRWFVLRLAGIYGPERHHLLEQVRSGEIGGRGEPRLNLVHRDDITAAVWACFSASPAIANQIFNVADDGARPKAEVVAWLAACLGAPAPRFTGVPGAGRRPVAPDRIIANAKLKAALGWQPRYPTFREGYDSLLSR